MGKTIADITEEELVEAWDALYSEIPPTIGAGEKTIAMIAKERDIVWKTAAGLVEEWVKTGRLESVGMRMIPGVGRAAEAWRPVKG